MPKLLTGRPVNKSGGMVSWRNPAFNFDSIGSAIQTMFYMATTEGWVTIMWAGQDVPERGASEAAMDPPWRWAFRRCARPRGVSRQMLCR